MVNNQMIKISLNIIYQQFRIYTQPLGLVWENCCDKNFKTHTFVIYILLGVPFLIKIRGWRLVVKFFSTFINESESYTIKDFFLTDPIFHIYKKLG